MNIYELTTTVLKQCRLEGDATDRSENQGLITSALNEAYRRICREKAPMWAIEAVTLDANKLFEISALEHALVKIVSITQYHDYSSSAAIAKSSTYRWRMYDKTSIVVPDAVASGTVYVKYEYMPLRITPTYLVRTANTGSVIPVAKAISEAEAAALADETVYIIDVSAGTYTEYTIESAAAGVAGAASITVNEAISTALAANDEMYIGENWEPVISEDWHMILTYWASAQYYLAKGANYTALANYWVSMFDREFANITDDISEEQVTTGAYSPFI